jgi:hypothetical protein
LTLALSPVGTSTHLLSSQDVDLLVDLFLQVLEIGKSGNPETAKRQKDKKKTHHKSKGPFFHIKHECSFQKRHAHVSIQRATKKKKKKQTTK